MFDETVSFETTKGKRTTARVAVLQNGNADPLDDSMIDTTAQAFDFVMQRTDWPWALQLRRGDTVTRPCGKRYTVQQATEDYALGVIVTARSA